MTAPHRRLDPTAPLHARVQALTSGLEYTEETDIGAEDVQVSDEVRQLLRDIALRSKPAEA